MAQVGRISGPLLKDNLLRNGVDLAFSNLRTDPTVLLKLDVNNSNIGVNVNIPLRDLHVGTTTQTDILITDTSADISALSFNAGRIDNYSGNDININAPIVRVPAIATQDILINDNFITTEESNSNLELRAAGSGLVTTTSVGIDNDLTVNGLTQFGSLNILSRLSTTNLVNFGSFTINGNVIETTESNTNVELRSAGTGLIVVENLKTDQDLTVLLDSTMANTNVVGLTTITGNTVQIGNNNLTGSLHSSTLNVNNAIQFENIRIDQNKIETTVSDSNLELRPVGSVEIFSNTNIDGNLHSTQDITFEGNITFGDSTAQDTVTFFADVNSDIVPSQNSTYDLSNPSKAWLGANSVLLDALDIETQVISVSGLEIGVSQGNTFYVSVNGDDTFKGDHQQGPFRTLTHALSVVDSSTQGPVTIILYPGEYEETFPLAIPSNVTIKGTDIRNCIVKPTLATQSNDAFLLEGETTVEDITIKDFYYDSINDTGYAFRYNSGAVISSRSPYIRNITVITQGSVTSVSDPRGFDQGDAGKGALVDGADVDSNSIDASMLFHSVTFITPGVDAITMTNGVRVEWLNSFTYFANRGLYATQGATGRLTNDGSTVRYGAELRSIGSASVYGNYGAVADGADTLMYLIGHNLAYIGTGKDVTNDSTLVIQTNETVEINSGKIYYTSTDARGTFRVGDSFFVDFDTGSTSIDASNVAFNGASSINIETQGKFTRIDATKVETGNIRLSGNTVESLSGNINWLAASGVTNINSNVNAAGNVDITGNLTFDGSLITLGDQITDTLKFEVEFDQDILPNVDSKYNLGSITSTWNSGFISVANIDEIDIFNNVIETTNSNSNLELRANGTGEILVPSNNVQIDNDLTVSSDTDLQNLIITGLVSQTGNRTHTGIYSTSNLNITQDLNVDSQAQFEEILVDGNVITTVTTDADLELRAEGTGVILTPNNNFEIDNDLYVNGDMYAVDIVVNTSLDINDIIVPSNIQIDDNFIRTTVSNSDLELRANGTGSIWLDDIYINSNVLRTENNLDIVLKTDQNNITIDSNNSLILPTGTILERTNVLGDIRYDTDFGLFEGFATSNIAFSGTYSDNRRTRVVTDNSRNILFIVDNNEIGRVTTDSVEFNKISVDDISIDGNVISTTASNADLELQPNGTGSLKIGSIEIKNDTIYNVTATDGVLFANTNNGYSKFTNLVVPYGSDAERGTNTQQGQTRWNSQRGYMEVYNGVEWVLAAGGGESVTAEFMDNLLNTWTLVLG